MPQFIVGALHSASAWLVSDDHQTLELPSRLLPRHAHVGSVLDLEIRINEAAEKRRYQELLNVFDAIYEATCDPEFLPQVEDEPLAYDEPSVAYSESNANGYYPTDHSVLESEDDNGHEISCNNARTSRAPSQSAIDPPPSVSVPVARKLSTPSPFEQPRLKRADSASSEHSNAAERVSMSPRDRPPVKMSPPPAAPKTSPLSPRDRHAALKSPRTVVSPIPLPPLPANPPTDSSLYALAKAGNTIPRGEKFFKTPLMAPIVPARLASSVSAPNLPSAAVPPLDLTAAQARVLFQPTAAAKDIVVAQSFSRRDEELAEDP